jgi:hypothetical protein
MIFDLLFTLSHTDAHSSVCPIKVSGQHYDYLFYLSFQLFIESNSGTETSLHETFLSEPQLS